MKYYDTIHFWFENKDYYHKIGYLIHEKALMYFAITMAMQKVMITDSGMKVDL